MADPALCDDTIETVTQPLQPAASGVSRFGRLQLDKARVFPDLLERSFECRASISERGFQQRFSMFVSQKVEHDNLGGVLP